MVLKDNIYYNYYPFPLEVWGVLYKCTQGHYHIGVNKNLTRGMQRKVLQHELIHIREHCPVKPYIIGLDMQHSNLEREISFFIREGVKQ